MAALVLSATGAAAGKAVFGPAGAIAGRLIGALAGNAIDRALFGSRQEIAQEGPRLADLAVMASTEGAPIPRVYGRARLPGQVIWATNLEEVVSTTSQTAGGGGKGMGGSPAITTNTTTYSYYANLAVGLCEGPIGAVLRIWADGKPLDLTGLSIRAYAGDEAQAPDPLIIAKDGDVPAYRGLAYVVFERLPLANFGNRIPQLSFEIVRPVGRLERMVRAVTLIPGTTEFGYAPGTVVQTLGPGQSAPENRHITYYLCAIRRRCRARRIAGGGTEHRTRGDRGGMVRHRSALRPMPGDAGCRQPRKADLWRHVVGCRARPGGGASRLHGRR